MVKARMLVEGQVQGVGFRVRVYRIAHRLGLKGLVRNLRNGQVEVFCEGRLEAISRFRGEILLLGGGQSWSGPRVDRIHCYLEGEPGFVEAWKEYSSFKIDPEWG